MIWFVLVFLLPIFIFYLYSKTNSPLNYEKLEQELLKSQADDDIEYLKAGQAFRKKKVLDKELVSFKEQLEHLTKHDAFVQRRAILDRIHYNGRIDKIERDYLDLQLRILDEKLRSPYEYMDDEELIALYTSHKRTLISSGSKIVEIPRDQLYDLKKEIRCREGLMNPDELDEKIKREWLDEKIKREWLDEKTSTPVFKPEEDRFDIWKTITIDNDRRKESMRLVQKYGPRPRA